MLDYMVAYPDAPLGIARSRSWRAAQARKKTRSQTSAAVAATHAAMQRLHAPPTEQATPPTPAATNDSVRSPACPTNPERRPHSRPSTVGAFVFVRAEQRCGRMRHLAPPCTDRRGRAGVDDVHGRARHVYGRARLLRARPAQGSCQGYGYTVPCSSGGGHIQHRQRARRRTRPLDKDKAKAKASLQVRLN